MITPNPILSDNLTEGRIDILRHIEFISIFFLNMDIYEAEEHEQAVIKTAACGVVPSPYIIINPIFWSKLTRKQRNFVLVHEVLHAFFEHHGRHIDNNYNHKVYNIATDFVINAFIIEIMAHDPATILQRPEEILYEAQYSGWTSDRVYHKLIKDDNGDIDKVIKRYNGDGVAGDGNGDGPLDSVSNDTMTDQNVTKMKQEISAGISIAETNNKSMSAGMGDAIRHIKDMLEPKIHWTALLQEFVVKASATRHTYNRLSRRTSGRIVFPSTTGDAIRMTFGCDSSGSMNQKDLSEAATELQSICDSFETWSVEFLTCDTASHVIGEYSSEDGDDFTSISMDFKGGGGTDMSPMIDYANDSEFESDVIVIVTDGYIPTESINKALDAVPVILIITSDGADPKELKGLDDSINIIKMN